MSSPTLKSITVNNAVFADFFYNLRHLWMNFQSQVASYVLAPKPARIQKNLGVFAALR